MRWGSPDLFEFVLPLSGRVMLPFVRGHWEKAVL